jgi:putative ABC transport system substrate-binding protein
MQFDHLKRREFITLLGGAAAWPVVARAQQRDRMRRVGVLIPGASDDPVFQTRLAAFREGLQQLGWVDGRSVRIDTRLGAGDADLLRKHAAELVALGPDVVMAYSSNAVPPLLQLTRAVPIVFSVVADPVGAGYVESLARPGGNVTGFTGYEFALSGKWLELLKEVAPRVTRAAILRDPADRAHNYCLRAGCERRPHRDRERVGEHSSQADHNAGGAAKAARGLQHRLLRHRRRPDRLWA